MNSALSEVNDNFINGLINSSTEENAQSGGFLFSSSKNNKVNEAVLLAAYQNKYDVVNFFIINGLVTDYSKRCNFTGRTLLQCLIINYASIPQVDVSINAILRDKQLLSFIDNQDNNGNTALHLATMTHNDELCEKLISVGADKKIKNKDNKCVVTETEIETVPHNINLHNTTTVINGTNNSNDSDDADDADDADDSSAYKKSLEKACDEVIDLFMKYEPIPSSDTSTSDFHGMTDFDDMISSSGASKYSKNKGYDTDGDNGTENFLDKMIQQIKNGNLRGGAKSSSITGTRRMSTLSEYNTSEFNMSGNGMSDAEISRSGNDNVGIIHEEVIEKIKEMLKKGTIPGFDKKSDEEIHLEARVLKAMVYKLAKEQNSDLKGEKLAEKMKKLTTSKELKNVSVSKCDEIREVLKNKPQKSQEQKRQQNDSSDSDSDSDPVQRRQNNDAVDKIHEDVIDKIKKMLEKGKIPGYDKKSDDEIQLEARVLKAMVYKLAKEQNSDLKGEQLAEKMKKLTTDKELNNVSESKRDEIREHLKNKLRRKEMPEQKRQENSFDTDSFSMSESSKSYETSLSATSYGSD